MAIGRGVDIGDGLTAVMRIDRIFLLASHVLIVLLYGLPLNSYGTVRVHHTTPVIIYFKNVFYFVFKKITTCDLAHVKLEKWANSRRKAPTREIERRRDERRRRKRNDGDEEDHNNGTLLATVGR